MVILITYLSQTLMGTSIPQDRCFARLLAEREIKQEVCMKDQLMKVRWGRVLLASILVVILTIVLNYVVFLFVFLIWGQLKQQMPVIFLNGATSSSLLVILLTFVAALWVAHTVERKRQLHGFLIGLIASLLLFLITSGFRGEFVFVAVLTPLLTIEAGWFGGFLGSRGQ
jgi:uncharacterized BrkB/YihY/UPF0761 family membrane protein